MKRVRPFSGAKVALFVGDRLVVTLRDDKPGLPWAAMWDFPGGGREGDETPWACAARETREEVGLDLSGTDPLWAGQFPAAGLPGQVAWFYLARLPLTAEPDIMLGDEGQEVALMSPDEFLSHPKGIDFLKDRLRRALAATGPV